MNPETPPAPEDRDKEISALIETLHKTEQRLEQLTAGEIDAVLDRDGQALMLRHAHDKLRHTVAARQESILNALPANIALLDTQGLIISVNEAWRRFDRANSVHGPGHGVGVNYLEICASARGDGSSDARHAAAGIQSVLRGEEKSFSIEYPCHSPTQQRWFLMTVTPLGGDHPNGAVVMHLNITDRKLNELEVIATRNQLQGTLDAIPDLLFELGLDGRYYDYHSPRIELLVAPPENLIGRTIFEALPADAANVVLSALQEANDKGISMGKQFELELPHGRFWFELSVSRKATAPGQEPRFICLSRDITARKHAMEKMRESEDRFSGAFEHAPIGMALVSPEGQWLRVNQALCALVGYTEAEMLTRTFQDITHPDDLDADLENVRKLITGEIDHYQMEKRYIHSHGHYVTVLLNVSLVRDGRGLPRYFIAQIQDISERKLAEDILKKRTLELERFHRLSVGRELQMIELKKQLNALAINAGQKPPHDLAFLNPQPPRT